LTLKRLTQVLTEPPPRPVASGRHGRDRLAVAAELPSHEAGTYRTGQVIMEPDPDAADHRTMDTVTPDGI
jgi:hypothetical protein